MEKDRNYFINPYHPIPIPKKKAAAYSEEGEEHYTGRLEYILTIKTPTFIPNTSNNHAFAPKAGQPEEHQSFDFFSYTALKAGHYYDEEWFRPVIPGSEIRGMIRSVYETLTDSCMSAIQGEEEVLSKRTMEYGKPGLLGFQGGKLFLYKANDYPYYEGKGEIQPFYKTCPLPEGSKVSFEKRMIRGREKAKEVELWTKQNSRGRDTGYLIKGNHGITLQDPKLEKHNCHIFQPKGAGREVSETAKKRFLHILESYAMQSQDQCEEEAYEEYSKVAKKFLNDKIEGTYLPIYHSYLGDSSNKEATVYITPSCVSRECYVNTIPDLIGDLKPCDGTRKICPACALFGVMGKKNEDSRASKLRFTDAVPVKEWENAKQYYTDVTTIPALGQPKLSNTEFYLKWKQNANLMTFDYYVDKDGNLVEEKPQIAGRKYYWHNRIQDVPQAPDPSEEERKKGVVKQTRLNRTIRAVVPETQFRGYVYFDEITERQLKQLVWILNFYRNASEHGYKIGMGKPLGLGSVTLQLSSDGCFLRIWKKYPLRIAVDIQEKPLNGRFQFSYEEAGFSKTVKKAFLFMTNLHSTDGWTVSYPYCNPDGTDKGFEWYVENHARKDGKSPRKRTKMVTLEHLKGFDEISKGEYEIADFKLPTRPGKIFKNKYTTDDFKYSTKSNVPVCFWKAKYRMTPSQEEKLRQQLDAAKVTFVRQQDDWLKLDEIEEIAKIYSIIALPSATKKEVIKMATTHFEQVFVALSKDRKDEGWKRIK